MRVLATWDPASLPSAWISQDPAEMAELGLSVDGFTSSPYAVRWDRREDYVPSEHDDQGWIGEDAEGIWMRRHPMTALMTHPDLWGPLTAWQVGVRGELSATELASMSSYEADARLVLQCAQAREDRRRMKRGSQE